jgi:hypothetical protein
MKHKLLLFFILCFVNCKQNTYSADNSVSSGSSKYTISFKNAIHHEAEILAVFTGLSDGYVEFRLTHTSPGRNALHEFVKNIF